MSYNQKKFLDINGLTHFIRVLDNYPTNDILNTVINAIQSSIDNVVIVSDTQPTESDNKIWIKPSVQNIVQVPTVQEMNEAIAAVDVPVQDVQVNGTSILSNGIANVPVASTDDFGVVKNGGVIYANQNGVLSISVAGATQIKNGTNAGTPIVPSRQHESVFYGLAKAAGADMANSSNAVGTYTDAAKTAIQTMLDVPSKSDIPDVPVTDVQVNGTSILSNGVANVPLASTTDFGVIKLRGSTYGIIANSDNAIYLNGSSSADVKSGTQAYKPITPYRQNEAVFYGLTKAAGVDMASSDNPIGTYTPEAKGAIQKMLGVSDLIAPEENNLVASKAYAIGDVFTANGKLYKAIAAIAADAAIIVDGASANCEETNIGEGFVKKTDYATASKAGIVKIGAGLAINNGSIQTGNAGDASVKEGTHANLVIAPARQHMSVFYGLSKVAGVDLANETVTLGTYPDNAKAAIRTMIDAAASSDIPNVPVQDVQINGISILNNGIATIPVSTGGPNGEPGLISIINYEAGLYINSNNHLSVVTADSSYIKAGTNSMRSLVPLRQHEAVFYGLTKAAGVDMSSSSNTIGTYTDAAKVAIRSMLGATSSNVIAVQDTQPTDTDTKIWLPETAETPVQIPTMEDLGDYVQKTDYATTDEYGLVKVGSGLYIGSSTGKLAVAYANSASIKNATNATASAPVSLQHESVFYGLAKASGDTTQAASSNAVGTYTAEAKAAIQTMLGVPGDVQVNGTSVISNGVANIPIGSTSNLGVVKFNWTSGVKILSETGVIAIDQALAAEVKVGTHSSKPIVPLHQHEAAFYGLAKAAGDTTQSASSNTVGTYTSEAKAAIQTMLGIEAGVAFIESNSDSNPVIVGTANTRYVCGEVLSINITPPNNGIIDIIFTSGTTPAVLTLPNTVKFPEWFDSANLEINTIYEINITDGIYGAVTTWLA